MPNFLSAIPIVGDIIRGGQALFTAPGTAARQTQQQLQQGLANQAGQIANVAGNNYFDSMKFAHGFDKQLQNGLTALAQSASGTGLQNQATAASKAAYARAMSQQIPMEFQNNPALVQAMRAQNLNGARDASNQALFDSYDPLKKQQAMMALSQAIGQYKSNYANDFTQMGSMVFGQPQVQVGPSFLETVAGPLATYFGMKAQS